MDHHFPAFDPHSSCSSSWSCQDEARAYDAGDARTGIPADASPDCYAVALTFTDTHFDANAIRDADSHCYSDSDANRDADSHCYSDSDANRDADSHCYSDSDANRDADSHRGPGSHR